VPQGYYTVERWIRSTADRRPAWTANLHLPLGESLTAAEKALEKLGKPGLYRIVQTQRVIWAEKNGGSVRLRKSHAASPEGLDKVRQIFERTGGRYPIEEAREARRRAKKKRAR
jgi:hypothetical protein